MTKSREVRVAILTRQLQRHGSLWLTGDLALALAERGCRVHVFLYDASGGALDDRIRDHPSIEVVRSAFCLGRSRHGVLGMWWLLAGHVAMLARFGRRLLRERYDLIVTFSAFGLFSPIHRLAHRSTQIAGFVWDFYPAQRTETGLARGRLSDWLIYRIEHDAIAALDHILVMTPDNAEYLRTYHPGIHGTVTVSYLWRTHPNVEEIRASTPAVRSTISETRRVVFGGSLVAGRDLGVLVEAASRLQMARLDVEVLIVGSGPTRSAIAAGIEARGLTNVHLVPELTLRDYLALLLECDVGVVLTSATTTSPSFPSKVLDYMWASLPVVACTRADTDFGRIIEQEFRCGVACDPSDPEGLAAAILRCLTDKLNHNEYGRAGKRVLEARLNADRVASLLVDLV